MFQRRVQRTGFLVSHQFQPARQIRSIRYLFDDRHQGGFAKGDKIVVDSWWHAFFPIGQFNLSFQVLVQMFVMASPYKETGQCVDVTSKIGGSSGSRVGALSRGKRLAEEADSLRKAGKVRGPIQI